MDIPGDIGLAILLTTIAGLSTGIGSTIAYFIKRPKINYLCFSLGLSAGVMLYVSFVELLPEALHTLGEIVGLYAFFTGITVIGIIDLLIPELENPHAFKGFTLNKKGRTDKELLRIGLFTALAIGIHNFPEGLATFGTTLSNIKLGIFIAFAIAMHNIPEGISVSIPIYYATGNKKKAFFYSFISGLAEPIAAVIGIIVLFPFLSEGVLSFLLAFVAGIMVYISVDELLPVAHKYGTGHCAIFGIIIGMLVMAASLLII
ncbi:zinc transporter ZupT [Thermoplasmatales archaeon SG8-52-4]|nr:MAG: zinc transporter ZupT [Thermoplasmatales archaeon SG8-52-4]